jgi:hypothetical protein
MSDQPESLHAPTEEYEDGTVEKVCVKKDEINIYLKNGKHVSVRSSLDVSSHGILPKLKITRGFWGKIGGE